MEGNYEEESREMLLRIRTGKKISITKRINKIDTVIANNGSRTLLDHLKEEIIEKLEEARVAHEMLVEEGSEGDWLIDLEETVGDCVTRIEAYNVEREGDVLSRASSVVDEEPLDKRLAMDFSKNCAIGECREEPKVSGKEEITNLRERKYNIPPIGEGQQCPVRLTLFQWKYGGKQVKVAISPDWQVQYHLTKHNSGTFYTTTELPPSGHEYKYIIDGIWKHDPEEPTISDGLGSLNNEIPRQGGGISVKQLSVKKRMVIHGVNPPFTSLPTKDHLNKNQKCGTN